MFANPLTERISAFVRSIGIDVFHAELPESTFHPGLDICRGAILVDEQRLAHPGDLLHEAGHIAVAPPEERAAPARSPSQGDEIATQAWSRAAPKHLTLDPAVIFRPHGYKRASQALIEAFSTGGNPGVPLLQWYGITLDLKAAAERGFEPFPHMLRWLR